MRARLHRFLADRRGGTATIFAMATPVLVVLIAGAIDLASVRSDRSKAQDVADSAALAAAKQLTISDTAGVQARAQAFADTQLADLSNRFVYKVTTTPVDAGKGVTVAIEGRRSSFFVNLLPPGGWKINVQATATTMGRAPLCVLASGEAAADGVKMQGGAQIVAPACMVHANADIFVTNTAWLQAGAVQTAGLATGRISPAPQIGAPAIEDPFTSLDLTAPAGAPLLAKLGGKKGPSALNAITCNPLDVLYETGVQVLAPGLHCGKYTVAKTATLRLMPGEHYFANGELDLQNSATLQGDDVVLIFDEKSRFKFSDDSSIRLKGRKIGALAGFVLATTRSNTGVFEISSSNARELLGTIYIPAATLQVTGNGNRIADQSAWTVVVSRSILMTGAPNLVINANYAGSSVPVPTGVGSSSPDVALSH